MARRHTKRILDCTIGTTSTLLTINEWLTQLNSLNDGLINDGTANYVRTCVHKSIICTFFCLWWSFRDANSAWSSHIHINFILFLAFLVRSLLLAFIFLGMRTHKTFDTCAKHNLNYWQRKNNTIETESKNNKKKSKVGVWRYQVA